MTQEFYSREILPKHIEHIKWLEKHHKHQIYLQEDNDPSHGTHSQNNIVKQLKTKSRLYMLTHPGNSPDLNPIESIWQLIKTQLRGGSWDTVEEFKEAIRAAWKRITRSQIRKRISEMKKRCQAMIDTNGDRYRSQLW